jgi:hypothetical protein
MALLRVWAITREHRYREALDKIAEDCAVGFSPFPGYCGGLAGLGHFFLDLYEFLNLDSFRKQALRIAHAIRLYAIDRPSGIAFPGHGLVKISCDFATGSAGIATFLHRTLTRSSAPLMLDEFLAHPPKAAIGDHKKV